jgi:hypothetical protein
MDSESARHPENLPGRRAVLDGLPFATIRDDSGACEQVACRIDKRACGQWCDACLLLRNAWLPNVSLWPNAVLVRNSPGLLGALSNMVQLWRRVGANEQRLHGTTLVICLKHLEASSNCIWCRRHVNVGEHDKICVGHCQTIVDCPGITAVHPIGDDLNGMSPGPVGNALQHGVGTSTRVVDNDDVHQLGSNVLRVNSGNTPFEIVGGVIVDNDDRHTRAKPGVCTARIRRHATILNERQSPRVGPQAAVLSSRCSAPTTPNPFGNTAIDRPNVDAARRTIDDRCRS